MFPDYNKPGPNALRKVRVGYWFYQAQVMDYTTTPATITTPRIREVRFDKPDVCYEGVLHGFGVEGDGEERCVVALVEKPNGTFNTPSVNTIQILP